MLRTLRQRARDEEQGFTLIELLVVILIIGILAAIALPTFLGQQNKGKDASAKSDARNAVSQMESCFTTNETYVGCPTASEPIAASVAVSGLSATGYTVASTSSSGNVFTIAKAGSAYTRTCTTAGQGGCPTSGSW